MDDGLEFSRSQEEESRTARVIRKCSSLFNRFITYFTTVVLIRFDKLFDLFFPFRGLDALANDHQHMTFFENVNLGEMVKCLEDLIDYFAQPEENIGLTFIHYL